MPEGRLSKEQLSKVQELATRFGVLLTKQLNLEIDALDELDQESPLEMIDAGEHVIEDPNVIGYLEDCLRLPDQSAEQQD